MKLYTTRSDGNMRNAVLYAQYELYNASYIKKVSLIFDDNSYEIESKTFEFEERKEIGFLDIDIKSSKFDIAYEKYIKIYIEYESSVSIIFNNFNKNYKNLEHNHLSIEFTFDNIHSLHFIPADYPGYMSIRVSRGPFSLSIGVPEQHHDSYY